jgi:DNA-binding MarR family transcriptional regulator
MANTAELRRLLSRTFRTLGALQRGEKTCYGVTLTQAMVLEILHEEGPMTVRDISTAMGLEPSTITRVVDVLARDGRLERRRAESGDRRQVFVSTTPEGAELAEKLIACTDAFCATILANLPATSRDTVTAALDELITAIESLPKSCC